MYRIITGGFSLRRTAFVAVEHGLIVFAVVLAAVVRLGTPETVDEYLAWAIRAFFVAGILQVCLHYGDLYDMRTLADQRDLLVGILRSLGAASVVLAIVYYWVPGLMLGRGVFALATVLIIALVTGWRIAFEWISTRGRPTERLLIVGTGPAAVNLARVLLERRSELGAELVGFVDSDPAKVGSASGADANRVDIIGTVKDVPAIVRSGRVDRVVVSLADARGKLNMDELLAMKLNDGVRFDHLASVYEQYTGKIAVENLRPSWMIFSDGFRKSDTMEGVKRVSDIVFAIVGLLLASPLMLGVWLALRFGSSGPAIYSQKRVGKDGVTFTIHKFRSMRVDAETASGAVWARENDPRVTKLGRFLRRTRLDELPQLWNVLRGDMSFVGPRPERPEFIAELTRKIPFYGQRHVVRPGLTGWAQVRHRYGASVDDSQEKLQYDLFYIKHMSFAFDLYIVLETVKTVLVRGGS
ncbi:TIGR03013 family XrtA/PEP-CTERM system glycosyltransferase [Luteitalea sp.]|uniref:TIGR03013 family XrtA/PEP-CTERM system glycosyltransferase n=1 Tax=Luteitalea sp. TaxID=2004800 RepID=UPI0025BA02A8|nr:TIGR03013 family XrtA/PEP-CTERM system glycosyltransferase [Luteitalea sp.]